MYLNNIIFWEKSIYDDGLKNLLIFFFFEANWR